MSEAKFPLCEKAGLDWGSAKFFRNETKVIEAADVEALLASAPVVYGHMTTGLDDAAWTGIKICGDATARLLLIERTPRDTAESLLREFAATFEPTKYGASFYQADLLTRTKAFLAKEGK